MILDGIFRVGAERARSGLGTSHEGEDLRDGRACQIHILAAEPTAARQSSLRQRARRLEGTPSGCLRWLGHGRVLHRSLYVAEEAFGERLGQRKLERPELEKAAFDLLHALGELHARALWHGTIGPEWIWSDGREYRLGGLYAELCWRPQPRPAELLAPERRLGLAPTAAADLYGLGAALYRLGTGADPGDRGPEELDALLGLGDLLFRDADRRPTAREALERLSRGGLRRPKPPSDEGLVRELARRLERRGPPLAVEGDPQSGARFLLTAVGCELRERRPVYLEADEFGFAPLGVARAVLRKLDTPGLSEAMQEPLAVREALESALAANDRPRPVLLIAGLDRADQPSRRLLLELCGPEGRCALLASVQGATPPLTAVPAAQPWRWYARLGLDWDGGQGLDELLRSRIEPLAEPSGKLLDAAAVAPAWWPLEELASVAGAAGPASELERAADELVLAGLLRRELDADGIERYSLVHPDLAERIRGRIEPARRTEMHRNVADLIELGAGPGEGTPFLLHRHRALAGTVQARAVASLVRQAVELGDPGRARELLEDHASALAELESREQVELLELADQLDKAVSHCRALLRDAQANEAAALLQRLGGLLRRQGHIEAAQEELLRAWEVREHLGSRASAELALDLVGVCLYLGRHEESQTWLERAAPLVDAAADPLLQVRHRTAQGNLARRRGQPDLAVRELQRARELLPPFHPERVGILTALANTYTDQGSMDEALQAYREAQELARRLGRQSLEENTRFNVALVLVRMDRLEAARAELDEMLRGPLRRSVRAKALGLMGTVLGLQGELAEARKRFAQAHVELLPSDEAVRAPFVLDEALLLVDHGEAAEAEALLEGLSPPQSGARRQAYLSTAALIHALLGRTDRAERLLGELGESTDPVAWEARGELLLQQGDPAGAVEAFESGLRLDGPLSSGRRRGLLLVRQARALLRSGRSRRAVLVLRQGLELLDPAPALVERLQIEVEREVRGGAPRSSRAYLEALLSLSEVLQRERDTPSVERLILEGVLDLLGLEQAQLTVFHPVTAEPRLLQAESGGGLFEPAQIPDFVRRIEPGAEPQRIETSEGTRWICGLLADKVPVGCLILEGLIQEEENELRAFLKTYCSLAGLALNRAMREEELLRRSRRAAAEGSVEFLIGRSAAMADLMQKARAMAGSDSHILILGDSGVGKTQLAREIHRMSPRRGGPFFHIDLASEPPELVSANLFGHEKGAFTGAAGAREGYIASTQGGTLFLDEIADISPAVQQKLLLFLQSKSYRPVGSNRERTADVRVLLATNKNLEAEIAAGRFRQDLAYRLASLVLHVPPLRERRDDIPTYCQHFFEQYCKREGRDLQGISPAAMSVLVSEPWPGNLRDLMNCLQRAVLLAPEGGWVEPAHLALHSGGLAAPATPAPGARPLTLVEAREALDRRMILDALAAEEFNRSRVARRLGITRQGLLGMMRRYGIEG
jgi:DNA-binding NtrC family response regulator/predicted negative regulator of RcsB-dependent stress response